MALRVVNILSRMNLMKISFPRHSLIHQSASLGKESELSTEDIPESIDAPLYQEELSETVLLNREKHLPERGQESPFKDKRRKCVLCRHNIEPDYKNVRLLSQFVSGFSGVVYGKHITGLCQKRQEQVIREIRKSRHAGLMAHYYKDIKYQKDPALFNPAKPGRPHPFF